MAAHIIPRSFWILDEGTPKVLTNVPGVYPARSPQGIYDLNILCARCDTSILGTLDHHAAETLLRAQSIPLHIGPLIIRQYPAAEPAKIALFIASVAWRASVSDHKFFKRIRLGRYEEVIRQMLLGTDTELGSVEAVIAEFDETEGTLDPHQTRFEGVRFSLIFADRFVFYVKTDRRSCPAFLADSVVRHNHPVITIPRSWKDSKERKVLVQVARSNAKAFPRLR